MVRSYKISVFLPIARVETVTVWGCFALLIISCSFSRPQYNCDCTVAQFAWMASYSSFAASIFSQNMIMGLFTRFFLTLSIIFLNCAALLASITRLWCVA